jgi:hypothetical protein
MQNGTRKGGAVAVFETLRKSPGFEDVWQLHWSYAGGIEHNAPGVFIANVDDAATIAGVLTAPPGGGRAGRGDGAPAPGGTAPAGPAGAPPATAAPATPPQAGAQPPAGGGAPGGGGGGGRGGGAAAAHTPAYYIKVSAQADGTFTVTNMRNGFSKTYQKRAN